MCALFLAGAFYPSGGHSMGGLMSGTSCFSHLCAFFQRLPIVPGSCSEKHKNIFSLVVQNNTALHCSQKYGETSQKGGLCTWL